MGSRLALVTSGALALCSCSLIKSTGLQTDYSFDAIEYASPTFGATSDAGADSNTVPSIPCDPTNDVCAAMTGYGATSAATSISASCDPTLLVCVATAQIRVSDTIDLTKQVESGFPAEAIQYGVQVVEVKRVTYWINYNQLTVATPPIDFYVAPTAARDETDPAAVLLTSIAAIPASSNACGDTAYPMGDTKATGVPVCSAPLPEAGKDALAAFVKDYKTPFQIIAHTVITAQPGEALPSGSITFAARPTVGLKILD
jgi:hypothetical protein